MTCAGVTGCCQLAGHRHLSLPCQCPALYRPVVPRPPKDFDIEQVSTQPTDPTVPIRTGPLTAVPARFSAEVELKQPELRLWMDVRVDQAGARPRLVGLQITSDVRGSITTSLLRRVLVDQLLHAAVEKASKPITPRPEIDPGAFEPEGAAPDTVWVSPPLLSPGRGHATPDERARTAALLYSEAVTRGSRAPAVAVANEMGYSRAQVARYIRRARQLGLLPPLGDSRDGSQNQKANTGGQAL
jgi:hypothetical protein